MTHSLSRIVTVPIPIPAALLGHLTEDYARLRMPALPKRGSLQVLILPDGTIPPSFIHWAAANAFEENTAINYARDFKLFLDFYYTRYPDADWREVGSDVVGEYLGDRTGAVAASTLRRNMAGVRNFYGFAARRGDVFGPAIPGDSRSNYAKGAPISRAHWVTRAAYERWRDYGLRGWGSASAEKLALNERNFAFVELMISTGMRRAEAGALLTVEIPTHQQNARFAQGCIGGATSKRKPEVGRMYYLGCQISELMQQHCSPLGARKDAVAAGRDRGIYEADRDALIVQNEKPEGTVMHKLLLGRKGELGHWVKLDQLTIAERMHIYRDTPNGLEPLWMWLGAYGAPMSTAGWWHVFDSANDRLEGFELAERLAPGTPLRLHPHMMRHTFVLHAYAKQLIMLLHARADISPAGRRAAASGNAIWSKLAALLGHSSPELTKSIYGAPADSLELEWYLDVVLKDPDTTPDLVEAIARLDRRVLDVSK